MKLRTFAIATVMALTLFSFSIPVSAASSKTLKNNGITWNYPATFKLKPTGCSTFVAKYVWSSKTSNYAVAAFDIEDADGGLIYSNSISRGESGKAGSLKLEVCSANWANSDGDNFVGAKKGTVYTTGRITDFGRKVIAEQVDGTLKLI